MCALLVGFQVSRKPRGPKDNAIMEFGSKNHPSTGIDGLIQW